MLQVTPRLAQLTGPDGKPLAAADAEALAEFKDHIEELFKNKSDRLEESAEAEEKIRLGEAGWKSRWVLGSAGWWCRAWLHGRRCCLALHRSCETLCMPGRVSAWAVPAVHASLSDLSPDGLTYKQCAGFKQLRAACPSILREP